MRTDDKNVVPSDVSNIPLTENEKLTLNSLAQSVVEINLLLQKI